MKKEKGIDDIFKHDLQNPANEPAFAEHDWDALENMLDKKAAGGTVYWLPYLSAAAAVVLIAFCWWMFKPTATEVQNAPQVVKTGVKQPGHFIDTVRATEPQIAVKQLGANSKGDEVLKPVTGNKQEAGLPQNSVQKPFVAGSKNKFKGSVYGDVANPVNRDQQKANNDKLVAAPGLDKTISDDVLAVAMPKFNGLDNSDFGTPVIASINNLQRPVVIRPLDAATLAVKKTSTSAFKPQFSLAVIASPEINGIGSFQGNSRGTNVGLTFTVGVKKFTFSTGATYSLKPYSLPFNQYPSTYTFKTQPETVTADCRILDIPINIGYQVYNKSRNKITLGTGVSSYIMMHESYTYDYGNASKVYGPSYYAVKGRGKYPFSVMNVQATYERQLNSKFGLSLQPYYKIPLSDIGYSQVKVQTFGVAVGLNWNINQLTKPK